MPSSSRDEDCKEKVEVQARDMNTSRSNVGDDSKEEVLKVCSFFLFFLIPLREIA